MLLFSLIVGPIAHAIETNSEIAFQNTQAVVDYCRRWCQLTTPNSAVQNSQNSSPKPVDIFSWTSLKCGSVSNACRVFPKDGTNGEVGDTAYAAVLLACNLTETFVDLPQAEKVTACTDAQRTCSVTTRIMDLHLFFTSWSK